MNSLKSKPAGGLRRKIKGLIMFFLFVIGYGLYFVTRKSENFFLELINHIGLFFSAVVLVHFIYWLLLKKEEQQALEIKVTNAVQTTIDKIIPAYQKWGFNGLHYPLDFTILFDKLTQDDELLWLDTYAPALNSYLPSIYEALERGATIKILALCPSCEIVKYRAQEIQQIGFDEDSFLDGLKNFIKVLGRYPKGIKFPGQLRLRLYDNLPCIPMYIQCRAGIPIIGHTSFFLGEASEKFVHLRWTYKDGGMLERFKLYFDNKWEGCKNDYIYGSKVENRRP